MSRKKKPVAEMTTEEIARMVFPRKVVTQLKRMANPKKTSLSRKKSIK
jgi:hypothetical protein